MLSSALLLRARSQPGGPTGLSLCARRGLRHFRPCAAEQQAESSTPKESTPEAPAKKHRMTPKPRFIDLGFSIDSDSAFNDLDLRRVQDEVGAVRVRQHVNVLTSRNQRTVPPPNWAEIFEDPTKPLFLDVGCGYGRFLLQLCRSRNDVNFVGMEVREKVAIRANEWAKGLGNRHVYFAGMNVNVNLASWVASYPGPIEFVAIQFPDPHFKRKHFKRRIVQPRLAREVVAALAPGGSIFIQSDIKELSKDMRDTFESCCGDVLQPAEDHWNPEKAGAHFTLRPEAPADTAGPSQQPEAEAAAEALGAEAGGSEAASDDGLPAFVASDESDAGDNGDGEGEGGEDAELRAEAAFVSRWAAELPGGGWLLANPLGVPTEREVATLANGGGVYRMLLVKRQVAE